MPGFDFALRLPTLASTSAAACLGLIAPGFAQQFVDQTAARFPVGPNEYTSQLTVGDLDNDNDLDLIFANGNGFNCPVGAQVLRIFINNGTGVFTDESVARTGGLMFPARGAELGDIERDGDLDIIVASDCSNIPALLVNNGAGVFTNQANSRLPNILVSSSRAQFGDVDNDGDLDLYFTHGGASRWGQGRGKLYLNNGAGNFSDVTNTNTPNLGVNEITEPQDCIFGDIDGDFDLDLRLGSTAGGGVGSKLFRNNGAGTFANVTGVPADNNCYSYDFGDINGDGDLDLLGANASTTTGNGELLLSNNGAGVYTTHAPQINPNPGADDNDSKFLDWDNDGDLDLIIAALGQGQEKLYTNNGTGTYTQVAGLITAINDSSLDVKVADVNSDGRYDIITGQGESGSFVNRIYMNLTGPVDTLAPSIVGTEQVANASGAAAAGSFVIRARIHDAHTSDRGFHDRGVSLNYRLNNGPQQQVAMRWSGNGVWRGVIPPQPNSGTVEYFVSAIDWNNNTGNGTPRTFTLTLPCPADTNGDMIVNVNDLLAVVGAWGQASVTHTINVQDNEFVPNLLDVKDGDTLMFQWIEGFHTATSGDNCTNSGLFNASITAGSPTFSYVIPGDYAGQLPFFCVPHCTFGMTGSANVAPFPDVNNDHVINVNDLLLVVGSWGNCP